MTDVTAHVGDLRSVRADAVVLGWFKDAKRPLPVAQALDRAVQGAVTSLVSLGDFSGKARQLALVPTGGSIPAPRVLLVGLGPEKDYEPDGVREAAARAVLVAREHRWSTLALSLDALGAARMRRETAAQAVAEGAFLGLFEFREFKTKRSKKDEAPEPEKPLRRLVFVERGRKALAQARRGLETGRVLAESTNLARRLIMMPSMAKSPEDLARIAAKEARRYGVRVRIWNKAWLRAKGMGGILGVGAGSVREPRLVELDYRPRRGRTVLLVGKGIVFDSGGINIKPSEGLDRMRYDMAGSATVLAATLAAARLRLPHRVVALMALAENMPSGSALRPGDIITAFDGTTIEVVNTDAEGRLVLADGLGYGCKTYRPDAVIDVATLTGAIRVALGNITTGIFGNDDALVGRLIDAGRRTGEALWRMPLNRDYEKQVESDVADLRNLGPGSGGAITAAAFLKQFVDGAKWAHLDIAGTCWTEKGPGELRRDYLPKGATGIGVRLIAEFIRAMK